MSIAGFIATIPDSPDVIRLVTKLSHENGRSSLFTLIAVWMVGVGSLDLLVRLSVLSGWPRSLASFKARQSSFVARRLQASYSLVIPVLCGVAALDVQYACLVFCDKKLRGFPGPIEIALFLL